jgi:hypothetical protein
MPEGIGEHRKLDDRLRSRVQRSRRGIRVFARLGEQAAYSEPRRTVIPIDPGQP